MKHLTIAAVVSVISMGLLGTSGAMADGVSSGAKVVGPQITREVATQTSKQVSSAAAQATREAQTR